jgi:hypothetical protein
MRENIGVPQVTLGLDDLYTCPTCGLVLMAWDTDCDSCWGEASMLPRGGVL